MGFSVHFYECFSVHFYECVTIEKRTLVLKQEKVRVSDQRSSVTNARQLQNGQNVKCFANASAVAKQNQNKRKMFWKCKWPKDGGEVFS